MLVAHLLLLKWLLALVQYSGHNSATNRDNSSNPAICMGPNLLSPASRMRPPIESHDGVDGEAVSRLISCSLPISPEFGCSEVPGSLLSLTNAGKEAAVRAAPHPQSSVQRGLHNFSGTWTETKALMCACEGARGVYG